MLLHASTGAPANVVRPDSPPRTVCEDRGSKHVIVVADRFAQFADGEQVLTVSELMTRVSSGAAAECGAEWVVHGGQGMVRRDRVALEFAARGGLKLRFADPDSLPSHPVPPPTVHKSRAKNVLLAGLKSVSKVHCVADLRIHRNNELILDHTAGHVPGMVAIEAMRQICIAHFETAYRPELPPHDYAGLWRHMSVSFEGFLFALPAKVVSEISEVDLGVETNLRFRTTTSVRQHGDVVASAEIEYAMVKQERIGLLERRKAARAARALLARTPEA